jgi:hypothetical protein
MVLRYNPKVMFRYGEGLGILSRTGQHALFGPSYSCRPE